MARRRASARRKKDSTLIPDLLRCVAPETAGDPCSGEKWVRSRLRGLSQKLNHRACPTTIGRLLREQKYGLRSHRKVLHTGKTHALRDQQFRYINTQREDFRNSGDPRISVDTKKKELLGQFKNKGQTWCSEGEKVNDHDFPSDAVGRAAPYGVYNPERNEGHVCVTTSSDTPDLAVDAVSDWWDRSQTHYPGATRLLIEADGGGSNGSRSRRYKKRLQNFADETGLEITVCHYPPGTSKWNPIEHRLFSQISATWAGYVLSTLAILLGRSEKSNAIGGWKLI
ncbi:MAG: ISAzo13 family transposase [Planctomycetes bacterium]|nr:ISAzo13 family transposase [Planctomycetota bacterium]